MMKRTTIVLFLLRTERTGKLKNTCWQPANFHL